MSFSRIELQYIFASKTAYYVRYTNIYIRLWTNSGEINLVTAASPSNMISTKATLYEAIG